MAKTDAYIEEAYKELEKLSADERAKLEYEARERAIRDYNSQMSSALRRGEQKGMERGLKRGMEKGLERGLQQGINRAGNPASRKGSNRESTRASRKGSNRGFSKENIIHLSVLLKIRKRKENRWKRLRICWILR